MVNKSIIGATCACLAVVSFNANAAPVSYYQGTEYNNRILDIATSANDIAHSSSQRYTKDIQKIYLLV